MRTTISSASASLAIAAALVGACSDPMAPAAAARRAAAAPSLDRQSAPEKVRYLENFKRDVDDVPGLARAHAANHGS
jgi:hypothetical protein